MCKTCGRLVNFLWSKRHEKFFCKENAPEMVETTTERRPSYLLSLAYGFVVRKISAALHTPTSKNQQRSCGIGLNELLPAALLSSK
jgi:hypothetical protein